MRPGTASHRSSPVAQADRERNRWWLVIAAGLAVFMASVDMSIVNVALPAIERDFEIATSMTEWVVLAGRDAGSHGAGDRTQRVVGRCPGPHAGTRRAGGGPLTSAGE